MDTALPPSVLISTLRLDLDFPLRSKSNYRRRPSSSAWSKNREFEQTLALMARSKKPANWQVGLPDSPLKDRPTVIMVLVATSLLDTANLSKSVADALEHELYHNDASIRMLLSTSTRSSHEQRATVLLGLLEPGATYDQMRAGLGDLLNAYERENTDSPS
jgi:Holliday junction resolvase RusA-like endonuclease